ncbi:MAG: hypothetical protein ACI4SR_05995 [Faecalibacillus sp.]
MKLFNNNYISFIVIQIIMFYALFICVSSGYLYIQYDDDFKNYEMIEEKNEKSELLILSKKTDKKVIEESDTYQMDYDNFNDFISDEEFDKIKEIEGIKEIENYYNIYLSNKDFKIYENGVCIKEIRNEISIDNQKVKGNIYLVGYDSFQGIKHQGKKIDGVYLNEQFQQLLDEDIIGKSLTISSNIPSSMKYNKDYKIRKADNSMETLKGYDIQTIQQDLSFQINGILDENEYNTALFKEQCIIYAPISIIEDILTMYGNKPFSYQTRQYMIHCQASQKESIKKEIKKLNSLYTIDDEYKNIYIKDNDLLSNSIISVIMIIMTTIIYFLLMNKKIDNQNDYKEIFNKTTIISFNITMIVIFIITSHFYNVILWFIPALILVIFEYFLLNQFNYKRKKT